MISTCCISGIDAGALQRGERKGMERKSRILIFTGDGKGKTTAALGMALRASGHGQRILILQFIKANPLTGELTALKHLSGIETIQMGRGFVPSQENPAFPEHFQAAVQALSKAADGLRSKKYDLIILDEICTAVAKGLLTEDQAIELIDQSSRLGNGSSCLVLTGRGATDRLISKADTVTEMRCVKHGLREGITAQKGVEY
jgi:cob(I)alamin adenosyltransferase